MRPFFSTAEKVELGALLLDNEKPGWYQDIDTKNLDCEYPRFDILGQLYGHTGIGCSTLRLYSIEDRAAHGHDIRYAWFFPASRYRTLTRLWRKAVERRLSRKPSSSDEMLSASERPGMAF